MKTTRNNLSIVCLMLLVGIIPALSGQLDGQTAAANFSSGNQALTTRWSIQVDQVDAGNLDLAYSFQIAIYENLVEELKRTKQFPQVFRDNDLEASKVQNLLVLKTTVEKYTPGSETQRAVTTVSGATKLTVRSQLLTRDGKVVLDRTVQGNVRFFGSNLRSTHNLARNIAKVIKESQWRGSELANAALT